MALALEILPVAMDTATAAWKTLSAAISGDADKWEEAVEGQRKLIDGLKEIPVIGKLAANVSEGAGTKLAHLLGRQSTAEMEAEIAEKKKAITDFNSTVEKIGKQSKKSDNEAALAGLLPNDAAIEKAKQKYKELQYSLYEQRVAIHKVGTASDDDIYSAQRDVAKATNDTDKAAAQKKLTDLQSRSEDAIKTQLDNIDKIQSNAEKVRDAEIAEANSRRLIETWDFHSKLEDAAVKRNQELKTLDTNLQVTLLETDNRGYAARLVTMQAALDKELHTIEDNAEKQMRALAVERQNLSVAIAAGNRDAIEQAKQLDKAIADIHNNREAQKAAARAAERAEVARSNADELRQARLAGLHLQGNAGDVQAKSEADRLTALREQETLEHTLEAIGQAGAINLFQQAKAAASVVGLRTSELLILQQQGELGNVAAGYQAKQLQLTLQQQEAELKLKAIIEDATKPVVEDAKAQELRLDKIRFMSEFLKRNDITDIQRKDAQRQLDEATRNPNQERVIEAQRQLEQLKQLRQQQIGNDVKDTGLFLLQQEAALGDKVAEKQLRKLEIEKQYNAEKQKLLGILNNEKATEKQKADAKKLISNLDAVEKRAVQQLGSPEKQQGLASLVEGNMLTGVQASLSQEKDQYAPIVDASDKHKAVSENIRDLLRDYLIPFFQGFNNQQAPQEVR